MVQHIKILLIFVSTKRKNNELANFRIIKGKQADG